MTSARDFIDPDTGKWVKEYAIAPRYTPAWMLVSGEELTRARMWPKVIGFDNKVAGYVVAAGEEPDVVQIAFPALDSEELEDFWMVTQGRRSPSDVGTLDKKTLEWRDMLLKPDAVAKGFRFRADEYRARTWNVILKNTNVYFEGSPVAWYDLDNGFVRYASLWDLAHMKQGTEQAIDLEADPIEVRRLWLLSEKQWDEAEFPPPIKDGPPFVKGITAAAEAGRMQNMARDHKTNDYPDLEAALLGAQSKFDATHAIARGNNIAIFSPSSRGYTKRVGFREKGFYHWPEKGELVADLPSNAEMIYKLIDSGWDPEMAPEVEHRRAAEEGERVTERQARQILERLIGRRRLKHRIRLEEFHRGINIELKEHADVVRGSKLKAGRIAFAHLKEDEHYYTKLERVGLETGEESSWCVTWINPKTRKRQVYLDDMTERNAHTEARLMRARHPDEDYRAERCGTSSREEARENPIDTGDGVPWVKIARDPEQYKEAMKEADAIGPIDDPKKVYELLGPALLKEDQEVFVVVLLDVRQQCRGVAEVHRGSRSRVSTSLVDILRVVLKSGAEGFVVVHNHPSGKASPSPADKDLTKAISKAAELFDGDLAFVDHVICGNGQYYSFADKKLFHAKGEKKRKLKRKAA